MTTAKFEAAYRIANDGWEYKPKSLKSDTAKFKAGELVRYKRDYKNPSKVYIADFEYRKDTTTLDNLCDN